MARYLLVLIGKHVFQPIRSSASAGGIRSGMKGVRMLAVLRHFGCAARLDAWEWRIQMERMDGVCGVKVFMGASTGQLLVEDDEGVERVLNAISRRAAFHSEDEYRLAERRKLARQGDWTSHPEVRDAEAAISSTRRFTSASGTPRLRSGKARLSKTLIVS